MKRNVELEAAEALLDVGILLPLLRFRLPGGRERVLRVTMRRPCLGGQMRIVRHYLKLGITAREWDAFSEDEERAFFDRHAKRLSLILALTICRGYLSGLLLAPVVAWLIRWKVPSEYRIEALRWFRRMRGTRDFTSIIESAESIDPFRYEASRPKRAGKGS